MSCRRAIALAISLVSVALQGCNSVMYGSHPDHPQLIPPSFCGSGISCSDDEYDIFEEAERFRLRRVPSMAPFAVANFRDEVRPQDPIPVQRPPKFESVLSTIMEEYRSFRSDIGSCESYTFEGSQVRDKDEVSRSSYAPCLGRSSPPSLDGTDEKDPKELVESAHENMTSTKSEETVVSLKDEEVAQEPATPEEEPAPRRRGFFDFIWGGRT